MEKQEDPLESLLQLLIDNPLLLLFIVAAIGYPLGHIKIRGSGLGVAAVLFVGLAIGSLHPNLKLPDVIYLLGLVLFVYTVGLSSGPGFFASFRRKGLRDNLLVAGVLILAALLTFMIYTLLELKPTLTAGLYAGSLTNTPALASILDYLKGHTPESELEQILAEPVVGYSIAYPTGVVGMILAIALMQRLWKVDYAAEARNLRELGATNIRLQNRTICVTKNGATQETVHDLLNHHHWDIVFGRMKRAGRLSLVDGQSRFQRGDLVTVVGTLEELDQVTAYLGEASNERIELDRSQLDYRRIFVSNPRVAGHRLRDLNLPQQYGAVVTRLRRGDIEFIPHGDTTLELGDRLRVLTACNRMEAVSSFLGDSYRALSEIDIMTFSLGLSLGLLLGFVPIPLPGGVTIELGLAGGPLIVAMVLGTLGRSGPLVWSLPYSANLTLRQVGLILFLAGVGTRAGYSFVTTLTQGGGLFIFLAGACITLVAAFTSLWVGYRLLKIPMSLLIGMLAGLQTQPAVLGFALEQTHNDLPNVGYATVYPVATITKILMAQLLITLLL
jgi:putative transport protein